MAGKYLRQPSRKKPSEGKDAPLRLKTSSLMHSIPYVIQVCPTISGRSLLQFATARANVASPSAKEGSVKLVC